MNSPSTHLLRADKIQMLINSATKKELNIEKSPYYDVFSNERQRNLDAIKCQMIVMRLHTWYLQAVSKARECYI